MALTLVGAFFRVWRLSSVPGVSGDEGWWGIQALAWLADQPYETNTTSGNPVDLFLLVPVAIVHAIAPASIAALRSIPVLANLLVLPVAFLMVRKIYGTTTATVHTMALAVLPTAIAHSRICQDPSQTVFWTAIVIYLSLAGITARRPWVPLVLTLLIFPIALWTHPTNVFIAPFLLLPIAVLVRPLLPPSNRARAAVLGGALVVLAAGALGSLYALRTLAGWNDYVHKPWFSMAAERMTDGALWFEFAANNARLFNGVTIYHYFSGARPWTVPFDAAFVMIVLGAMAGFVRASRRSPAADAGLIAACAGTWLLFYGFAGPDALRPHFERWGLCLLVPGSLVIARGTAHWIEGATKARWIPVGAAGAAAAALLVTFHSNYFAEFAASGGRSHLTYVTAPIEPKAQALAAVIRKRSGTMPVTVVASQWWLERPVRYLASRHPNVDVVREFPSQSDGEVPGPLESRGLFAIEFVGTPELDRALAWMREHGLGVELTTIHAADGRPLLAVLQAVH